MGFDYYIVKYLHIYYESDKYFDIEVSRNKGYYNYDFDEDDDDYEQKVKNYINKCLQPNIIQITIYENEVFMKPLFETKYKNVLDNKIKYHNKSWSDIIKIVKVEDRYEI